MVRRTRGAASVGGMMLQCKLKTRLATPHDGSGFVRPKVVRQGCAPAPRARFVWACEAVTLTVNGDTALATRARCVHIPHILRIHTAIQSV